MRRAGKIGLATSVVVAAGVVTGGMLAVGQGLKVDDNPGKQLTLEGVETGVAAQDASGAVSGARIRAEGSTPKVEEVVEQPVVNEVPPSDPVVIAPRRTAPAPVAPAPPAPAPKHDGRWGDGHGWGDSKAPKPEAPKPEPQKPRSPWSPQHGGGGGGHDGGHGPGPH